MSSIMDNFPEISFIDNTTLESIQQDMINDYQDKYEEITEESVELQSADPDMLVIYAAAVQIFQAMMYIDRAGKMNFTKYAYEDYLDNLGAWKGVERSFGKAASSTLQFSLSAAQSSVVTIPAGTRATAGNNIYFYTDEVVEIPAGETTVSVGCTCSELGELYNGYEIGKINILVDPIPYVASVTNISESSGGEDLENDESLSDRIYLAPSAYAVGTDDGYIFRAKTYNKQISDVKVYSSSDATVNIVFLCNGEIPSENIVQELQRFFQENKGVRGLTDKVVVSAPNPVEYEIDVEYYVSQSDSAIAKTIQNQVDEAIENYISWQKEKIGRDIEPSTLNQLIRNAGASKCMVNSPQSIELGNTSIAKLTKKTVTYGGIKND